MFTPAIAYQLNTSRSVELTNPVARAYFDSLQPVTLEEVNLIELLHTLFVDMPTATADSLDKVFEAAKAVGGTYRDADGTLVVHRPDDDRDRLSLLWPVGRPLANPGDSTIVRGGKRSEVFAFGSGTDGVVPLAAASADHRGYAWGYSGTGPINLYMALVFAVTGKAVSVPDPRFNDDPRSLFGWVIRQNPDAELRISWPDLVRRVQADEPLRR